MVLNWTIEVVMYFISAGIIGITTGIAGYRYIKKRERYVLWLFLATFGAVAGTLQEGLAYLFLFMPLFSYAWVWAVFFGYMVLFLVDAITRELRDPLKTSLWTGICVWVVLLAFQPDSFSELSFPNGDKSLATAGIYQYVSNLFIFLPFLIYLYYFTKIHRIAPKKLKKQSRIFLYGSLISVVIIIIITVGRITLIIPGINIVPYAILEFIVSFVFIRHPQLAFIFPFKVLRLTVIDTESGIPLFTHTWSSGAGIVNEDLFSGMLQGVSLIVKESLNRGNLREISLEEGILIVQRSEQSRVAFVLIANRSSRTLRDALQLFAKRFNLQFRQFMNNTSNVSHFSPASALVEECFSFVPDYE